MQFAISNQQLNTLEASQPADLSPLEWRLALAWHYRQRSPERAQSILAALAVDAATITEHQRRERCRLRIELIHAEHDWLSGNPGRAGDRARAVFDCAARIDDMVSCADAQWLVAWAVTDQGDMAARDAALTEAMRCAAAAHDPARLRLARIARLRSKVFVDFRAVESEFHQAFQLPELENDPLLWTWANDTLGLAASNASNFTLGIERQLRAHEAALDSGQIHRSIFAAINLGVAFNNLGDHLSALEWLEKGIRTARDMNWPACLGMALMQSAEPLRMLGRRETAQSMLDEALMLLAPFEKSHNFGIALLYLFELQLERGQYEAALHTIARIEARDGGASRAGPVLMARRGKAQALGKLGRIAEARAVAESVLTDTREFHDPYNEVAVLVALADISESTATLPAAGLPYLEQALTAAAAIDGYAIPADLLERLGRAYQVAGDINRSCDFLLRALEARKASQAQEAANRAIAVQVWHETERARIERDAHQRLAQLQQSRAEALQRTTTMLQTLSVIGQEITAELSGGAILEKIEQRIRHLLDATYLSIYQLDADGAVLVPFLGKENGVPVTLRTVPLSHPTSAVARCVRERRPIIIDYDPGQPSANQLPGTLSMGSGMFAPLIANGTLLGVMSIQSQRRHAYGETEELIFHNLCAYGAIALDNANAYHELAKAQQELHQMHSELERAYRRLEEQSTTDPLTGLRNRRFLIEQMEREAAMTLRHYEKAARRGQAPSSQHDSTLFMIDLDHFKQVNDVYGHAAGDAVLAQLRTRLEQVFRDSDYLVRWGGEEFLIVARGTCRTDAPLLAERARRAVADTAFDIGPGMLLERSCSIGYASFPFAPQVPHWLTWVQVCELADRALYMAKQAGRNQSVGLLASEAPPSGLGFTELMNRLPELIESGCLSVLNSGNSMHCPQL
jgi:diguanylate cyclase (GGDEF)-like protein